MLAYIFWHFPSEGVDVTAYERSLEGFHKALDEAGAEGFVRSRSFRIQGVPWINDSAAAYADWYLVEGSFALDTLNDLAVSGARRDSHDRAAGWAAGGAGALYRLVEGEASLEAPAFETWLSKPRGTTYEDFYAWARPAVAGGELWRRQMVLGPALEFCLVATRGVEARPEFQPRRVERAPLGTGG